MEGKGAVNSRVLVTEEAVVSILKPPLFVSCGRIAIVQEDCCN